MKSASPRPPLRRLDPATRGMPDDDDGLDLVQTTIFPTITVAYDHVGPGGPCSDRSNARTPDPACECAAARATLARRYGAPPQDGRPMGTEGLPGRAARDCPPGGPALLVGRGHRPVHPPA